MRELSNGPIPDPQVLQTEGLQIGDHRLSTSCEFVERPDHRCGDDLVLNEKKLTVYESGPFSNYDTPERPILPTVFRSVSAWKYMFCGTLLTCDDPLFAICIALHWLRNRAETNR